MARFRRASPERRGGVARRGRVPYSPTMRLMTALPLLVLPLLAACASEREICERRATQDLRALDALIAETQTALARGFREEREVRVVTETFLCPDRPDGGLFCDVDRLVEVPRRVAIDPAAEERKLAGLQSRRAAEEARARSGLASCAARHPTG